jgi:glycosyltransferase involved in cell wall biosynthesis
MQSSKEMEEAGGPIRLTLLTEGDPGRRTGGFLYQQRLVAAASNHGARVDFVSIPRRSFALQIAEIRQRLARLLDGDLLLIDSIVAGAASPWLRRIQRTRPVLAIVHQQPGGVDPGGLGSALRRRLDLQVYRRADGVVPVSDWLAAQLVRAGVDGARIAPIPPGRPTLQFGQSVTSLRQGRMASALCVSNWYRNKGIGLVLEAVAKLRPNLVTLHLVGDPSVDPRYGEALLKRIALDDLQRRVVVHGSLPSDRVGALLNGADLLVHGSRHEAYGSAIAEAMTAGLSVVAFAVDNIPYLVRHGIDGFVLNYPDIPGMSAAIAVLATDLQRRKQMAEMAKNRAMSWPSWEETADRFFSLARGLAERYAEIRR